MTLSNKTLRAAVVATVALVCVTGFAPAAITPALADTGVAVVVNKTAITNTDLARRIAFLKLRHETGDVAKKARQELIDEQLKRQEIARVGMSVSTTDVDQAFGRFAASNKLSTQQMGQILDKAGVGVEHFKAYIAVQMSWPRLVNARYASRSKMSTQDMVTRLLENKQKPVTTEYTLKQVIFVVPVAKRATLTAKRKAEADASRAKFPGCDQAMDFAKNYLDVSIRDLGRVMKPELPDDWKPLIEGASGNTTGTRVTERGVEYLAICEQKQVSDDLAAEAVFKAEDIGKEDKSKGDPNSEKYLTELRSKAQIINR
ncbi:SurA N-terminal domain-containing protein [Agrobacterium vitis]|uniref:Peptidylprolyl isomerase n=1 Tax=Agrobacterium vitis TaxID=373 RepID=A0A1S2DYZ5_AGRVI|nr:SurA N-terminal domain-containing protein [Agrobacterium vitis]MCE6074463.1 peptidylprolyl isomerase [Agrobacterium vitis]MCF1451127.1 peptidylprolyl isomerase [Agrobacterium vitis]MCM2470268.1 peptidylprolyl isomerase [Agrobacterium vitis]MUO70787.1 peptidylprolyl isomerase [Agrobacterium vitis]MUO84528.1 peptidylprolyl isomerase [Agrobacterium vitis]